MLRVITVLCLVAACWATPVIRKSVPRLDGRIVGGEDADIVTYPYQLSLINLGSHSCGASIISVDWCITAAHCAGGLASLFSLRAGSSVRGSGGTLHNAARKVIHNEYVSATRDFDFAVIQVDGPFIFELPGVNAIALPTQGEDTVAGTMANATGWGATVSGGSLATQLQVVTLPIATMEACREAYGVNDVSSRMICAGAAEGGVDFCNGDNGGPLAVDGVLIGIASWGSSCGVPNFPGVYAKVSFVRTWILDTTGV